MAVSARNIGRALLPWGITAAALIYVFGYAIDWKAIPEATAKANLTFFIGITVFDKIVFFLVWTYVQAETIRRFIEPVTNKQVLAIKGGSELLRSVNNSLADATFFLGVSQITKAGMSAVVAVAFIPFGAHFAVLVIQATLVLPILPGGPLQNQDVLAMVVISWIIVGLLWFAIRRGYVQKLLDESGMGGWLEGVTLQKFMPFLGYFALFAVFDVVIQGVAARAFGTEIGWLALVGRIPLLYLAISIPSLANFGTREIAWANLFSEFGSREELIAFALWTNLIFLIMHVLIGSLFISRALSLIRDLRQARKDGETVQAPLLRDPIDP